MRKCPHLEQCPELVDRNTYEIVCCDVWEACEKMAPFLEKKKPSNWAK